MPGPGFAPPDLCSIRAAAEQEELAEAAHGGFSADGYPPPMLYWSIPTAR